jgi:hypothetical protein
MSRRIPAELLAEKVRAYMDKYPNTTRYKISTALDIGSSKLLELEQAGLITLPPKVNPGNNSYRNWTIKI